MKRLFLCLLAASVLITCAACGAGTTGEAESTMDFSVSSEAQTQPTEPTAVPSTTAEPTAETEPEEERITFDDVVLMDDDNVTVYLVDFYQESSVYYGSEEPTLSSCITLRVSNKSERKILFNFHEAYVGEEAAIPASLGGNSGPAPGKTKNYHFDICRDDGAFGTPVALDELYALDGYIEIVLIEGEYSVGCYDTYFNIADALSGTE